MAGGQGSDAGSEGEYDNDTSVSSYLEDVGHFLRVAQSLAGEADVVSGPLPTHVTETSLGEWGRSYAALEKRLGESEQEVTLETLDPELKQLGAAVLPAFHRLLLNWHCLRHFPFHEHMPPAYLEYLECFFKGIAADHLQTFMLQGKRDYFLSAYTFSHRVKGERCNSARISYGAASDVSPELLAAAQAVLRAEKASAPAPFDSLSGAFKFYGLGWDFGVQPAHIKLYLHGEMGDLPDGMRGTVQGLLKELPCGENVRDHILVAFTIARGDPAQVLEEKIYLYPRDGAKLPDTPSGVLNVAYVVSTGSASRGIFQQWDVSHGERPEVATPEWRPRFCETGQRIYDGYYKHHMRLDTLAYGGPDDFTLYFPFEP